jgi:RNA polymerase sigma factor (sigma-70 family)
MLLGSAPHAREEDATLIDRLRAGDEHAFETIVARHRPRMLAFARSILRSRPDTAEDVVQEAFMRAHKALLRDDRTVFLGPWLAKLTRNCALDEISRVKADTVPLDTPAALVALVDNAAPDTIHERRANVRSMLEGIATLPEDQRHALLRREVDGASHAEIAAELGISGGASRALITRARANLVKRNDAIDARCTEVQDELLRASRTGRRASAHAYRHLATCKHCRAYRGQLRAMRGALHALHPGGVLLLGAVAAKLGLGGKGVLGGAGGKGIVAGAAAKSHAGIAAVVTLTAVAAVGGTLVITAGQPSPETIHSAVLPGHLVVRGAPLPAGTAVAMRTVALPHGAATTTVACPSGYRVADLLPSHATGVTAGYTSATHPGVSNVATITLAGSPTREVGIAILCRMPGPSGTLTPALTTLVHSATSGGARPLAITCVRRDYLHTTPGGDPTGSIARGEKVAVLARANGWRQIETQFRKTGWVRAGDLCG